MPISKRRPVLKATIAALVVLFASTALLACGNADPEVVTVTVTEQDDTEISPEASQTEVQSEQSEEPSEGGKVTKVGETIKGNGGLQVTLISFERGAAPDDESDLSYLSDKGNTPSSAEFVRVEISADNKSTEAEYLYNMEAQDSEGRRIELLYVSPPIFTPDATIELEPGMKVRGYLAFVVPKNFKIASFYLPLVYEEKQFIWDVSEK